MPLRVAFDLDGTLADMVTVLRKEAEQLFGAEAMPKAPAPEPDAGPAEPESKKVMDELHLSAKQQMRLWEHVRDVENFWCGLPEVEPGIVARIAQTAAERRWEVIFLTTRPLCKGETTQLQSQRWLEAHGFPLPSVFVVQRSRGKIA
jgi:hypothetical protein